MRTVCLSTKIFGVGVGEEEITIVGVGEGFFVFTNKEGKVILGLIVERKIKNKIEEIKEIKNMTKSFFGKKTGSFFIFSCDK
jgi:hypothetical protein